MLLSGEMEDGPLWNSEQTSEVNMIYAPAHIPSPLLKENKIIKPRVFKKKKESYYYGSHSELLYAWGHDPFFFPIKGVTLFIIHTNMPH